MMNLIGKQILRILALAIMWTPIQTKALELTDGNEKSTDEIVYSYNYIDKGDGTVILSKYDADGNWLAEPISPRPVGEFTVPDEIDGKRVVAIGNYFLGDGMTSVVIPANVTNMTEYAFIYACNLTNITVAAGNPSYKDIDGILCTKDGKTLVACPRAKGGDISVAVGTELIGQSAFYNNNGLRSIAIPDGVKEIGGNAFWYCSSEGFTSVTIPASVEKIGSEAFRYCSNLADVTFAGDEDSIDIDDTAFAATPYDATKPFSLIVEGETLVGIHGTAPENLNLADYLDGKRLTGIGSSALSGWFYNTSSTTDIVVPEGVTWISNYAFEGCEALESVTLPATLQSIYYNAFYYCTSMRTIRIPPGVTDIDYEVFDGCENLTVTAPETLRDAFSVPDGCTIEYYEVPEYTVTFDANGGTVDGDATAEWTIREGSVLGQVGYDEWGNWGKWLPAPIRSGYAFLGWFTAAEGGDKVTADTVVTGDMTLYAHWAESPFTRMSEEYPWTVDGDGNWINGEIPAWSETWMEIDVEGPCKVSFQWMRIAGSMSMYIDGRYCYLGVDSGEWNDFSASLVDEGKHTVRFVLSTSLYSGMPITGVYCI